jgi:hypothetical protein
MATALTVKAMDSVCGFCATGYHDNCPIGVVMRRHAHYPNGIVWVCACQKGDCAKKRRRCTNCNNTRKGEVDKATWLCKDTVACNDTVTVRRDNDPLLESIRKAREMAKVTETEKKAATKAATKPKTGTCVCGCKGTTKGGLFLPGHDARFVSSLVGNAEEKGFTKTAIADGAKALKDAGASDTLQPKYPKSVPLAQERAAKKEQAAKDKQAAKDAAKAESKS